MSNDKVKLEWLDETTTYTYGVDNSNNENNNENNIVCPMRDWPDDIKAKLDNLAGALDRGLKLCQDIMDDEKLNDMSYGNAEWLEERLVKAYGVLTNLVYVDPMEDEWEEEIEE